MEAMGPAPPLEEVMSHTLSIPDEWLGTSNMLHPLIILLRLALPHLMNHLHPSMYT